MVAEFENQVSQTLEEIKSQGLFKTERVITSPQDAHIAITGGKCVLNMCANNYLGLADHPALVAAAKEALEKVADWLSGRPALLLSGLAERLGEVAPSEPRADQRSTEKVGATELEAQRDEERKQRQQRRQARQRALQKSAST